MKISEAIPVGAIPAGPGPGSRMEPWFGSDSRENAKGSAPNEIAYQFNKLGYRCAEFDAAADIRIVSIGGGSTFGLGLAHGDLFHEEFAARLGRETGKSVVDWNLAGPDKSSDYIARMLHLATPILKPDIVLILFPPLDRRECMTADGRIVDYGVDVEHKRVHPVVEEIFDSLDELASPLDDQLNFFRNYRSVSMLLRKTIWLYGFETEPEECALTPHLDRSRYAGEAPQLDLSRDRHHPGRDSQALLSEMFWDRFAQSGAAEVMTR